MSFLVFLAFSLLGPIPPCRLNMRTTIAIYNNLYAYLTHQDSLAAAAAASSSPPASPASPTSPISPTSPTSPSTTTVIDTSIDPHFRSGVYLGVGMCNIILSMMPGKLMTLVELFGYHGDRKLGLSLLEKAGGWECAGRFFLLSCFLSLFLRFFFVQSMYSPLLGLVCFFRRQRERKPINIPARRRHPSLHMRHVAFIVPPRSIKFYV